MKTAISVDGRLLTEADRTARELGLSRSRLFSLALEAYLRHRRQEEMIEQLNRAYGSNTDAKNAPTLRRMKTKFRSTIRDRW